MSAICGTERIGETGIRWVCVAPPHGAENAPLLDHVVERIATGMLYPRSHQHWFISEEEAARRGIATPIEQMVR